MGIFRKTSRAGLKLSRKEIKAIKKQRKQLRKELKAQGIKSKEQFEVIAASKGLYFDKHHPVFAWIFQHWLGSLIGMTAAFLTILFVFSTVQEMRGHYTINVSERMLQDGFTLSDDAEFTKPTSQLFSQAAEEIPCVSISHIPENIDSIDGPHNDVYFAHTFYIRNEGQNIVDYTWNLTFSRDTQDMSSALWFIIFEDGNMRVVAKASNNTKAAEAIPAYDVDNMGYTHIPIMELAPDSDQFEVVAQRGSMTYWRVVPDTFVSDTEIVNGTMTGVEPMEVHKYTVVMYLEGDDPEATDDRIGGSAGVGMDFRLVTEEDEDEDFISFWKKLLEGLKFQ